MKRRTQLTLVLVTVAALWLTMAWVALPGAGAQSAPAEPAPDGHALAEGVPNRTPAASPGDPTWLMPEQTSRRDELAGFKALDAEILPEGRTLLAGRFAGTVSLGGVAVSSDGGVDGLVVRLGPTGAVEFFRRMGGAGNDAFTTIEVHPGGGFVVGGHLNGQGTVGRLNRVPIGAAEGTSAAVLRWGGDDMLAWSVFDDRDGGSASVLDVDVSPAGTTVAAGWRDGTLSLDGVATSASLWRTGWAASISATGKAGWVFSPQLWTEASQIEHTDDGHVAVLSRGFPTRHVAVLDAGADIVTTVPVTGANPHHDVPMASLSGGRVAIATRNRLDGSPLRITRITTAGGAETRPVAAPGDDSRALTRGAPLQLATAPDGDAARLLLAVDGDDDLQRAGLPDMSTPRLVAVDLDSTLHPIRATAVDSGHGFPLHGVGISDPDLPLTIVGRVDSLATITSSLAATPGSNVATLVAAGTVVVHHRPEPVGGPRPVPPSDVVTFTGVSETLSTPLRSGATAVWFRATGTEVTVARGTRVTTLSTENAATYVVQLDETGRVFALTPLTVSPSSSPKALVAGPGDSTLAYGYFSHEWAATLPAEVRFRYLYAAVLIDSTGAIRWGQQASGVAASTAGTFLTDGRTAYQVDESSLTTLFTDTVSVKLKGAADDGTLLVGLNGSSDWSETRHPSGATLVRVTSTSTTLAADGTVVARSSWGLSANDTPLDLSSSSWLTRVVAIGPDGGLRWQRHVDQTTCAPLVVGTFLVACGTDPAGTVKGRQIYDLANGALVDATVDGSTPRSAATLGDRRQLVSSTGSAETMRIERWGETGVATSAMTVTVAGPAGPIEGTTVEVVEAPFDARFDLLPPGTAVATGISGADGRTVLQVRPGAYWVRARDPQGRYLTTWAADAPNLWRATKVRVDFGQPSAVGLTMAPSTTATIAGRVRDDAGRPAGGVAVWLFDDHGWRNAALTGADGWFHLGWLPPGAYRLAVMDPSEGLTGEWWNDATGAAATPVEVADVPVFVYPVLHRRQADLAVTTAWAPDELRPGDRVITQVRVTNTGAEPAGSTTVAVHLHQDLAASTFGSPSKGTLTDATWTVGTLAPGESATLPVDLALDPAAPAGQLGWSATASTTSADTDPSDDRADRQLDVVTGPGPVGRWATMVKGPGTALGYGVAVGADGSTFVSGWFLGEMTFGTGPGAVTWNNTRGAPDMFFMKLDENGATQWVRRGTTVPRRDPTGGDVVIDPAGNIYVVGFFEGGATFTSSGTSTVQLTNAGGMDAFLLKYAPDGTLLWGRSVGGWYDDYGWSADLTPDGDVVVSGRYNKGFRASVVTPAASTAGGFVLRYDPEGSLVGSAFLSATAGGVDSLVRDLDVTGSGSVVVAGSFAGELRVEGATGVAPLTASGGLDGFVAVLGPLTGDTPTVEHLARDGGPGDDRWTGAAVAPTGELTLVGRFGAGATVAGQPAPESSGVVARLTAARELTWVRTIGQPLRKVLVSPLGGVVLYGGLEGVATFETPTGPVTVEAIGAADGLILVLDDDGKVANLATFGGAARDLVFGLAIADDGHLHLSGSVVGAADVCRGPGAVRVEAIGEPNAVLARCAPIG